MPRFAIHPPVQPDVWATLDTVHGGHFLDETDGEAQSFDVEAREQIELKLKDSTGTVIGHPNSSEAPLEHATQVEASDDQPCPISDAEGGQADISLENGTEEPTQRSSGPLNSTPHRTSAETVPNVNTPAVITPRLPKPKVPLFNKSLFKHNILETPDHIASPIDTPDARLNTVNGISKNGEKVDAETPVPIGSAAFSSLRGKKDFQTLTKHFEAFNKSVAKAETVKDLTARSKGKNVKKGSRDQAGVGGRVFEGLRFCIPPELGQVSKHKQRWDIIAKLGGQVTLQPDTAITHVIYDRTSASILCRELGIRTLSELPEGTICVKWDYVASCKLAGQILDPAAWLSFPKNAFTRTTSVKSNALAGPSRFSDITDQLCAASVSSISRKRVHTASESDTESPQTPYRGKAARLNSAMLTAREPFKAMSRSTIPADPKLDTVHDLSKGPGWIQAIEGEEDGLDEMISGLKNGTTDEAELSDTPEADVQLKTGTRSDEIEPDDHIGPYKCQNKSDGSPSKNPNEWLAVKFDEMHDMYQGVQGKNHFAIRQYQQAASVLRRTVEPITSGAQALKFKGVGKSIADRIDEFISGSVGRQQYENNEQVQIVSKFKDIYGVGTSFANELYRRGARSIDDLRTHDYGLTPGQKIGLELYDDLKCRIPRDECRQIYEYVRSEALAIDDKIWIEIMGSYRRGQESSGDVDFLITRDPSDGLTHAHVLHKLVNALKAKGIITHHLSVPTDWKGLEAKWMGVCRVPGGKYRRIDILCIPYEQWGAALIFFTGNTIFNRSLRLYARKQGYSLNQRGLYHGVIRGKEGLKQTEGEIVASRTEQAIFDVLGVKWRHPHHRRP